MVTQLLTPLDNPPELLTTPKKWPLQGEWTYEDYLRLPDDNRRYEIIKGVLYVTNAPGYDHQFTVMKLSFQLERLVSENNLGIVLTAPFEVHLLADARPVQPDIMVIKRERQPAPGAKFFEGVPDVVVEVLSPSSIRRDRHIKFNIYEQAGVAEYWLADPKTRSIEIYTLSGGEYALLGQFIEAELIESQVLNGLSITTKTLFNT